MASCLMSFGSVDPYNWNVGARFIERVLKSAKAVEMPVEQALKIKFAVNPKTTGDALGITIAQSILLRTDEVI